MDIHLFYIQNSLNLTIPIYKTIFTCKSKLSLAFLLDWFLL